MAEAQPLPQILLGSDGVPSLAACGYGLGDQCCVFLAMGPDSPLCLRGTRLHQLVLARAPKFQAQRIPQAPYPHCQLEVAGG